MSRAGFTVVSATGKVSSPQANVPRPETYTNASVSAPPQLAMQLSRAQVSDKQQAQSTQHPFSSGSKLIRDIKVTGGVPFRVAHNLGRKVCYLAVRLDGPLAAADCAPWVVSDDANSVTLATAATGNLTLLVF